MAAATADHLHRHQTATATTGYNNGRTTLPCPSATCRASLPQATARRFPTNSTHVHAIVSSDRASVRPRPRIAANGACRAQEPRWIRYPAAANLTRLTCAEGYAYSARNPCKASGPRAPDDINPASSPTRAVIRQPQSCIMRKPCGHFCTTCPPTFNRASSSLASCQGRSLRLSLHPLHMH